MLTDLLAASYLGVGLDPYAGPVPLIPDRSGSSFAADRASLADFDPVEVAADCGALSLLSANGHRLLRLNLLTTLAAERKVEEVKGPLGRDRLCQLLTEGDVASHADRQEDPFEDELTEEVSFFGGLISSGRACRPMPTTYFAF